MYAAIMHISKYFMQFLPNIHQLTTLIITFTIVYGVHALIPIYIYVFIDGVFSEFGMWWYPYLYIWTLQCLITLLLPRKIKDRTASVIYPLICSDLGLSFGLMHAFFSCLENGKMSIPQNKLPIAWIASYDKSAIIIFCHVKYNPKHYSLCRSMLCHLFLIIYLGYINMV